MRAGAALQPKIRQHIALAVIVVMSVLGNFHGVSEKAGVVMPVDMYNCIVNVSITIVVVMAVPYLVDPTNCKDVLIKGAQTTLINVRLFEKDSKKTSLQL